MDHARVYWLCILGIGFFLPTQFVPDIFAGNLGIAAAVVLVGSVGMVVSALYALRRPERFDAPTKSNLSFWAVVLGFVLVFAGTVLEFI